MSPPRLVHDSADPPQESGGASGPPNGNGLASRVSVLESELKHLATKKDVSEIKVWALTGALGGMVLAASLAIAILKLFS